MESKKFNLYFFMTMGFCFFSFFVKSQTDTIIYPTSQINREIINVLRTNNSNLEMTLDSLRAIKEKGKVKLEDIISDAPYFSFFFIFIVVVSSLMTYRSAYLEFKNRNLWHKDLDLKKELRIPIQQYLSFFKEYVRVAKGVDLNFETEEIDNGVRLKITENKRIKSEKIERWFDEYIEFIEQNINSLEVNVETEVEVKDVDILIVKLQNNITNLENQLRITQLENHFLKEKDAFNQQVILMLGSKEIVIHNQYIQGGDNQFADKIDNKEK